ncbi:uncharacterized protein LOC100846170 isoform X2 [Brachypodium distachyon]|uniref:Uncharacterized protein n=1 Tax=Brachypodium distachyon TaxID=15368 RepID=A0A2K2CF22_BRADI|nr:uncharacterized protein LOC100846170 isoform X2 [Brachypodium distachyon]PNT60627.1 hypothetical protein BRADI_5g02625v3 [Brachypodium distachyon]|eukprot:XP_010239675.1 uncharacterized protein LOC100846170 isoform X2 [Brachypodium distachyon]
MNRVRSEDLAVDRAIDRYGIHEVGGPLLVGGVDLLNTRTGLFCDNGLRHILTDEQRFRAYLEFREQAFQIAVTELMSGAESTVDMFLSIAADRQQFGSHLVEYMLPCTRHDGISSIFVQSAIDRDGPNGSEAEKLFCRVLYALQRYFALRRLLVKLDFIQSHMNFLKKYVEKKMDPAYSISEYENLALKKINSELSSELQKHLDLHDWRLMQQYYDRMKLRRLARECAIQAQMTGTIIIGEALPIRKHGKENILSANLEEKLPLFKEAVKQSLNGYISRIQQKFRSGAGRPLPLLFLGTFTTIATWGIKTER